MSTTDTPETDRILMETWLTVNVPTNPVPASFARRLERERDEARRERDELREKYRTLSEKSVSDLDRFCNRKLSKTSENNRNEKTRIQNDRPHCEK